MKPRILALTILFVAVQAQTDTVLKHSFRAPFHTDIQLPFWQVEYGAKVTPDYIRITPAKQSRIGAVWNTIPSTLTEWEVTLKFQVTGQPNLGGDGFAFWYVEKPNMIGSVYGGMDYWDGLGVFFDTFNNDGAGDHPSISAIINDGQLKFDAGTDGATQARGHCSAAFRNRETPTQVRVKYQNFVLSVSIDLDSTDHFMECFAIDNVELGVDKFFGLTAATGDVADNHDVMAFQVRDMSTGALSIEDVRHRFREKQHTHHMQRMEAASQPMDSSVFQNSVLSLLNQIQSTQNLMEQAQITMANALAAGVARGGGGAASAAGSSDDLAAIRAEQAELKQLVSNMRVGNDNMPSLASLATLLGKVASMGQRLDEFLGRGTAGQYSAEQPSSGGSWLRTILTFLAGWTLGSAVVWYAKRSRGFKLP